MIRSMHKRAGVALALALSLVTSAGCNDLLDVTLPASLTDEALNDPTGAETVRNSVINEFESAYNQMVWEFYSREDGGGTLLSSPGVDRFGAGYESEPGPWFQQMASSRRLAAILHDKVEKVWTGNQVTNRQQYLAITSMYAGAALGTQAAAMCDLALDGGKLMTPNELLTVADGLLTKAIGEITTDFAMPYGIAPSAKQMAYGLRAQIRWEKGDKAGAIADAALVPKGFKAFVTRDAGSARRNQPFHDGPDFRFARLLGIHDWWSGSPNPVTGKTWPAVLPFTGYLDLGIAPDGRAVRDDGLTVRTTGKYRIAAEDGAVPDPRVPFFASLIQGDGVSTFVHHKYTAETDDIPLVNWKEMYLIRAELEGGQKAIDYVNEIRTADNLPKVTYADPSNATQIRYMVLEERRRALFVEGRWFPAKVNNLDVIWFPRNEGKNPTRSGDKYGDAIRLLMPATEYILNPNLSNADRGTKCGNAKPTNII